MRRLLKPKLVAVLAVLFAAACVVGVCTWWTNATVERATVRNDSSHGIQVGFMGSAASCLNKIRAHSVGSFKLDRFCRWWFSAHPFIIIRSDGTREECDWDVVRRIQPIVVTETGASCALEEFH